MTTFIIIAVLVVLFFLIGIPKGNKKNEADANSTSAPTINLNLSTASNEEEKYHVPIKQVDDGWVINPGCPFELTIMDCDYETAQRIRELCDQGGYQADKELLSLFATKNIKIKEIEEYKKKYAPVYYQRIEELKFSSQEYKDAGLKDKEMMEEEFKVMAQDCIYELPEFDVYKLFIDIDLAKYHELIENYDFECIEEYFYNKPGSIVSIKGNPSRAIFDRMSEMQLAIRGYDIPLSEILNTQNLKVLNAIANNPQKEFKRKSQAVEYILGNEEAMASIEKYIAFRELYKTLPLPNEFEGLNKETFNKIIESIKLQVLLLQRTYNDSAFQWERTLQYGETRKELYKTCKVNCSNDKCKCAQDRMKRSYSMENPPQTPCHIGCSCWLDYE